MTHSAKFWNDRYETGTTGWDIGYVSTPLKEYFDQLTNKTLDIFVPGCGNSYEAEYLLEHGLQNITLLDISDKLIRKLKKKFSRYAGKELHLVNENFFHHHGQYDLIIEQTFFCALKPEFRAMYVEKMHELLKPHGKLAGLLFNIPLNDDHPPYGGNIEEYKKLFSPLFNIQIMEMAYNSILPREGNEVFIKMVKK